MTAPDDQFARARARASDAGAATLHLTPARPLFGVVGFSSLFVAQALGAFNDNAFKTAFVSLLTFRLAADLETNPATLVALANGALILPFALLSPIAGQLADRVDKAAMMRVVKACEIVLMLGAYYAYSTQSILLLYALIFSMGVQSAFFGPIKYGALPVYLRGDELVRGNGLVQAATFLAILLGTVIGTNLILAPNGVAWISALAVSVAVVGYVASRYATPVPPLDADGVEVGPTARDMKIGAVAAIVLGSAAWAIDPAPGLLSAEWAGVAAAGLVCVVTVIGRSIREAVHVSSVEPGVLPAILCISWFWFAGATFLTLIAPLSAETFGGDASVLTALLAAFSIGVAAGAVLVGRILQGAPRVGPAPIGALGIAVLSVAFWAVVASAPEPPFDGAALNALDFLSSGLGAAVLAIFVGLAVCAGIYVTPLNAVYQSRARADARGRTVAAGAMFNCAFMAVSAVLIVWLSALSFTPAQICAFVGATGVAAAWASARLAQTEGRVEGRSEEN